MKAIGVVVLLHFSNCFSIEKFVVSSSELEVRKAFNLIYENCPESAYRIPCFLPIKVLEGVKVSSGFGQRIHPVKGVLKHHNGIDIASTVRPVIATASGRIKRLGYNKGLGKYIIIDHENSYETTYAHLSKITVFENNYVNLGDEIGMVGSTGNTTGNHIHYEIRKNHQILNPTPYLLLFYYANN
jgi:murein DD-endopeptidase MepM/ murein hydrolase activator NlpD